jgi:hypothetical protein
MLISTIVDSLAREVLSGRVLEGDIITFDVDVDAGSDGLTIVAASACRAT